MGRRRGRGNGAGNCHGQLLWMHPGCSSRLHQRLFTAHNSTRLHCGVEAAVSMRTE